MSKGSPAAVAAIAQRRAESLGTIVQNEIERMILSGEFKAGERISEQSLAARLGVSRGPVREATSALEQLGLVTAIAHRGVFVRKVEVADLLELYDVRALLTGFACALLARQRRPEQLAQLRELLARMAAATASGDGAAYYQINLEFHAALMTLSGHRKSAEIYGSLLKTAHLARRVSLAVSGNMQESEREHVAIVDAIAAGDAEAARRAGEEHVLHGKRRMVAAAPPDNDAPISAT